jgi:hypothetical protein
MCFPEISVNKHQSTLRNMPEERISRRTETVDVYMISNKWYYVQNNNKIIKSNVRRTLPVRSVPFSSVHKGGKRGEGNTFCHVETSIYMLDTGHHTGLHLVGQWRCISEVSRRCMPTHRSQSTVLTRGHDGLPHVLSPEVKLLLTTLSSNTHGDLRVVVPRYCYVIA